MPTQKNKGNKTVRGQINQTRFQPSGAFFWGKDLSIPCEDEACHYWQDQEIGPSQCKAQTNSNQLTKYPWDGHTEVLELQMKISITQPTKQLQERNRKQKQHQNANSETLTDLRGTIKTANKVGGNFIFTSKHGITKVAKLQYVFCFIHLRIEMHTNQ